MKLLKQMICLTLSIVMILSFSSIAFAAETITIDTVTIQRYEDEFGSVDDELVTVVVEFTITNASEQMTLLLTSENISEISEETAPKIIFMDQSVTPDETTYKFNVEKSRIKSATGLDDIDGCTLYVKMGAKGVSNMATTTIEYFDPTTAVIYGDVTGEGTVNIGDAIKVLRYDAKLESLTPQELVAAEVTGDGAVNIGDAIKILRYDAKLETTLK